MTLSWHSRDGKMILWTQAMCPIYFEFWLLSCAQEILELSFAHILAAFLHIRTLFLLSWYLTFDTGFCNFVFHRYLSFSYADYRYSILWTILSSLNGLESDYFFTVLQVCSDRFYDYESWRFSYDCFLMLWFLGFTT